MNQLSPEDQEATRRTTAIVNISKDALLSGWQKIARFTHGTDFLAIVEPSESDNSILILPRGAGLAMLRDKGFDIEHQGLAMLQEAATGFTLQATALWVVVLFDGKTHVTKIIHQPMTQAGSA